MKRVTLARFAFFDEKGRRLCNTRPLSELVWGLELDNHRIRILSADLQQVNTGTAG